MAAKGAGIVVALTTFFAPIAYADQFSDQINSLNSQIQQSQAQVAQLHAQADTLANQLAAVNAQIAGINAQIKLTQAKYDKTVTDIDAANQQLEIKKGILAENVRQIYQQSNITPLEILASSKNFSDFIDRQQYLDRLKDHIQDAANAILQLKQQLEKDKADAQALLQQQQSLKDGLAIQQAQAAQLLADTQGQEANYQAQVTDAKNKLNAIIAARAAAIHNGNLSVSSSGCGGYPSMWCNASQDSLVDDWYYYNRECVSYVAWKRYSTGHSAPYGWGNAYQWASHIDHSSNPQPGDIAVWGQYANNYIGYYGHVAYVESNNGGSITFSQYNFDVGNGPGRFSTMTVPLGSEMLRGIGYIH